MKGGWQESWVVVSIAGESVEVEITEISLTGLGNAPR